MTVYVVPCGVSLLEGIAAKKAHRPRDAKPGNLAKTAADVGRVVLGRPDGEVLGWWRESAAARHATDAKLGRWEPRVLCAETSTLAASSGLSRLGGLLDRGDIVLVLASDTDRGVASALYVAQYIAGLDLAGVTYLSAPQQVTAGPLDMRLTEGTLTVLRVRGLNPKQAPGGFIDAVAGIGRALRVAFDVGDELEVHLTGGFKATLLHTMAMTEVLYSLAPDRVRAVYLFEDADAAIMPIGLRRFSREECHDMRLELSAVRDSRRHLGARTFKGIAWDDGDGKLNAFGYGYLAVLGEDLSPGVPGPVG